MEKSRIIDILLFFGQLIDRAKNRSSFSPKLRMSVSHPFEENVLWSIYDSASWVNQDIRIKPVQAVWETMDNILIVRDYFINLTHNIENYYNVYLDEEFGNYDWRHKKFYEKMKKIYPEAFEEYEDRVKKAKQISEKMGVNIKPLINEEGDACLIIKTNAKELSWKQKIRKILEMEKVFITLYSELLEIPKEKFITKWSNQDTDNLLKLHRYTLHITNELSKQTQIIYLQFTNNSGIEIGTIDLKAKHPMKKLYIQAFLTLAEKPKQNTLIIDLYPKEKAKTIIPKDKTLNIKEYEETIHIKLENLDEKQLLQKTIETLTQLTDTNKYNHPRE